MKPKKSVVDPGRADQIMAEARREQQQRLQGYRERALKLFPWVCARCGREFSGKKLAQLTVHHKDHNHDNNRQPGCPGQALHHLQALRGPGKPAQRQKIGRIPGAAFPSLGPVGPGL